MSDFAKYPEFFSLEKINVITGDMYTSVLNKHCKYSLIGFMSRSTCLWKYNKNNKILYMIIYKLLICKIH